MLSYLSIYQERKEGKKKREKEITQQEIKL